MSENQFGATEQSGPVPSGQGGPYGDPGRAGVSTGASGAGSHGQTQGQVGAGQQAPGTGQEAPTAPGAQGQGAPGGDPQVGANPQAGYAGLPPGYAYADPHWTPGHAPDASGLGAPQYQYFGAPQHPPHPSTGYYAPPPGVHPQYEPAPGYHGMPHPGPGMRQGQDGQAGMSQLVEEISNGGNGLSSLGKMLNLDDSEFWKGALIGAAAVLLLTNESVQSMLFKTGAKAKEAMQDGVEKVKETASEIAEKTQE